MILNYRWAHRSQTVPPLDRNRSGNASGRALPKGRRARWIFRKITDTLKTLALAVGMGLASMPGVLSGQSEADPEPVALQAPTAQSAEVEASAAATTSASGGLSEKLAASRAQREDDLAPMVRLFGTLTIVAAMGMGALFLSRSGFFRKMLRKPGSHLQVEETAMLGGRQFLVVVRYGNERRLLGVGQGFINDLCGLPEPPAAETNGEQSQDSEAFARMIDSSEKRPGKRKTGFPGFGVFAQISEAIASRQPARNSSRP